MKQGAGRGSAYRDELSGHKPQERYVKVIGMSFEGGDASPPKPIPQRRRLVRCEAAGADGVDVNSVGANEAIASGAFVVGGWLRESGK